VPDFQDALVDVGHNFNAANKERAVKFPYLHPTNIIDSISV
jgi:hypothetical protein